MRWSLLFFGLFAIGWSLPVSAVSFGNDIQKNAVCGGANTAEEKVGSQGFGKQVESIYKAAESQQPSFDTVVAQEALNLEATRLNFIQQNKLSASGDGTKPYRQEVDEKGQPIHIFTIMSNLTKKWDDDEYVRKQVEKLCNAYYADVAPFCIDSFYKRKDNVKAFLDQHKTRIASLAENPPDKNQTWVDVMGNENFDRDQVTDGNLTWNASPYLPVSVIQKLGGVPTMNDKNQIVGFMVGIDVEGVEKQYFAELRGDQVMWPYFFIFGNANSDEWNKVFEQKHGSLKVGEMPLHEWQQMRSSLSQNQK